MAARPAAAVQAPQPARTAPRERRPPTATPRARPRRRGVAGGVISIAVIAVLLAGVVALNVAVLRLNVGLDQLGEKRSQLRSENAELASQISSSVSSARIQLLARQRYGLVPADPGLTTFVDLGDK